ncbi:hypothetical protein H2248_003382 [Termitomyces sp. 'cryptogamus']|nr:hypothetical protein H2248_003382 [Termitomyces sp. 'cryptogamus']
MGARLLVKWENRSRLKICLVRTLNTAKVLPMILATCRIQLYAHPSTWKRREGGWKVYRRKVVLTFGCVEVQASFRRRLSTRYHDSPSALKFDESSNDQRSMKIDNKVLSGSVEYDTV